MDNNLIVCGGTFDHFHKGHKSFLRYVFSFGKKSIVGISSDEFVRRWKVDGRSWKQIESFEERKKAVLEFIKKENILSKVEIVEINDLFGPTLSKDLLINAIVISEDTKKGAEIINQKRKESGLNLLKVFIAPSVKAEDGKLISSARIRNGEIDRGGKLYVKNLWLNENLKLAQDLREEFKKPFGDLLKDIKNSNVPKDSLLITVGDITAKIFNEQSLKQNISVIDFKVARKEKFSNVLELGFTGNEKIIQADNPAGYITSDLFTKLSEIFRLGIKDRIILQIKGEEDLAVLPLILIAPLNTIIYYGQPSQGIVKVEVSEKIKEITYGLVDRFEVLE